METDAQEVQTDATETADPIEEAPEGAEPKKEGSESSTDAKDPGEGIKSRIDELTKKWRTEQRERAQERMQRESLQREIEHLRSQRQEPESQKAKTLEDFGFDEGKFQDYLFRQAESRAAEVSRKAIQEAKERESKEKAHRDFNRKVGEFQKDHKDFWDVVRDESVRLDSDMFTGVVSEAMELDAGPEVLYHLGKNPEIAYALLDLSPKQLNRELARLEARIGFDKERAAAAAAAAKVSKAPEPAAKIEGSSARPAKSENDMDDKEWGRARQKEREAAAKKSFDGRVRANGR